MLISAAGPGTNLLFSIFCLVLLLVGPARGFVSTVASYGFALNVGLGAFNMLPIPPMDGYKVFKGNIPMALAIALPLWGLFLLLVLAEAPGEGLRCVPIIGAENRILPLCGVASAPDQSVEHREDRVEWNTKQGRDGPRCRGARVPTLIATRESAREGCLPS